MQKEDIKKLKAPNVIIVKKLRDYSNEPFFKKKKEEAIAYLKKYGLYDELTKKK